MKKIAILIVIFFFGFIFFALLKTPAAVALNLANPYLPKDLQIGKASGSIWQGRIMQLRYQDEQINNLNWDISGWALFTGQLTGSVKFGDPRQTSELSGRGDFSMVCLIK